MDSNHGRVPSDKKEGGAGGYTCGYMFYLLHNVSSFLPVYLSSDKYMITIFTRGARDGAVVRALASHQCGLGSNPGVDAICELSLLLVLSFAPRGFSPGTPVFPSPQKPTFPNSNSTRNKVDKEPLCGCATSQSWFIYYFIYLFIIYFASGHNNYGNLMVNKLNFRSQGLGSSTASQLSLSAPP